MKKYILFLFIISMSFASLANNIKVNNTYIKGLYRIPEKSVLSKITQYKKKGYLISYSEIRKIIRNIYSLNFFDNIKVFLDNKNNLIFELNEYPVLDSLELTGNKLIKSEYLNNFFKEKGILVKEQLNKKKLFDIKKELINKYYDEGYHNASIYIDETKMSLNRIKIKVIFKENKPTKIDKIQILGNKYLSNKFILNKINLYNYNLPIIKKITSPVYKRKQLLKDLDKIKNIYKSYGYLNFLIKEIKTNFNEDKTKIDIEILISEGDKYNIKTNELIGDFDYEYYSDINKIINNNVNSIFFNFSKILVLEEKIKNFLKNKGYSSPSVNVNVIFNNQLKEAKLQFNILSGPKLNVRNINITGNKNTSDKVIRKEIHHMEFSTFNHDIILEDINRLNKLKYFNKIDVQVKPINHNQVDLIYSFDEKSFSGFKLGFNVSNLKNFNIMCNILYDNFLGNGNLLSLISNYKKDFFSSELSINNFDLINDRKIKLGSKLFSHKINKNVNGNKINNLNYGLSSFINIPIGDNTLANCEIILNINKLKYIMLNDNLIDEYILYTLRDILDDYCYLLNNNINTINFNTIDYILSLSSNYNNLNNLNFPTKGTKILFSCKYTLPIISSNKYESIFIKINNFFTDKKFTNITYENTIQISNIMSFYIKDIPFCNFFFLDKIDLVRGFVEYVDKENLFYNEIFEDKNRFDIYKRINDSKILIRNELHIPSNFIFNKYKNMYRISLFADLNLNIKYKNKYDKYQNLVLYPNNYESLLSKHASAGIAFNLLSWIGPIKLSYSIPLIKGKNDKIQLFQLNISNKQ